MAFQQVDLITNTTISKTAIQNARTAWSQGQYAQAWQILADAGDRYADNAVSVLGGSITPAGIFFRELVKNHWLHTTGSNDTYDTKFQNVAQAHLNRLVAILKNN